MNESACSHFGISGHWGAEAEPPPLRSNIWRKTATGVPRRRPRRRALLRRSPSVIRTSRRRQPRKSAHLDYRQGGVAWRQPGGATSLTPAPTTVPNQDGTATATTVLVSSAAHVGRQAARCGSQADDPRAPDGSPRTSSRA